MIENKWCELPAPPEWGSKERYAFLDLAKTLSASQSQKGLHALVDDARRTCASKGQASLTAAAYVLCDLAAQGWAIKVGSQVHVMPAETAGDVLGEKERVRQQELVKRNEQLSQPSVRKFVVSMERPRKFTDTYVSVFNLMRDGGQLRSALERAAVNGAGDVSILRTAVDPYVQIVTPGARCQYTGLLLSDIWRYFRHTWTNYYATTPGRSMPLIVRDRAAPFHPVIGIAALSSAIVQLKERDDWIGWQSGSFIAKLESDPTPEMAYWLTERLEHDLSELYLNDLVQDGLYWPSLWDEPSSEAIEGLVKEAKERRQQHHQFVDRADFKSRRGAADAATWRHRAESDLFRSKRCVALAELLRARAALLPFLRPEATSAGLSKALNDRRARHAIAWMLRRAKSESVGTEMADLSVCGAIAPYNAILGGKLVAMLAVSPTVVRAYRDKYNEYDSEIASSVAGRAIRRPANLTFIGTTSLYGSGASQYNRIRIPAKVLDGTADIQYRQLGKSKAYGTSHLSSESVTALVRLSEQSVAGALVSTAFSVRE